MMSFVRIVTYHDEVVIAIVNDRVRVFSGTNLLKIAVPYAISRSLVYLNLPVVTNWLRRVSRNAGLRQTGKGNI